MLEFGQLNFCCFGECEPVERSDNYLEYILLYFLLISDILYNLFALYDSLIVHNLKLVKDAVVVQKLIGSQTRNIKVRYCSSLNSESNYLILSISIITMTGMKRMVDCFVDNVAAFENDAFLRFHFFHNLYFSSLNSEPN